MTIDQTYELLPQKDSPYFAGTACLLSLLPILRVLKKDLIDFDEAFPEIEQTVLAVMDEDGRYFELSLKEKLTPEEWFEVIRITDDYTELISALNSLRELLREALMNRYLPLLDAKTVLLSQLCRMSLGEFFDKPEQPEEFPPAAAGALMAIRG